MGNQIFAAFARLNNSPNFWNVVARYAVQTRWPGNGTKINKLTFHWEIRLEETTRIERKSKEGGSDFLFKFAVPPAVIDWLTLLLLLLGGEKFLNTWIRVHRGTKLWNMNTAETGMRGCHICDAKVCSIRFSISTSNSPDTFKSLYFRLLNCFR